MFCKTNLICDWNNIIEQAGAELCQAQAKLRKVVEKLAELGWMLDDKFC